MRRAAALDRLQGLDPAAGLTSAEVERRRGRYGRNDIVEAEPGHWKRLLSETARDPMLWFLAATSAAYFLLDQPVEGAVLLLALLPLLGMDALLHYRTAASTEGLSARLASRATVERDGSLSDVPAVELVPGDLVRVAAGGWFPADGLIVGGGGMQVDESSLSGESYPVEKEPLPESGAENADVEAERHWGLAGTRLLTGEARQRVVWTGGETLYGEIVRSAIGGLGQRTPLQEAIANLVRGLVFGAAAVCLVLAYVRLRQGFGWLDALLSGVTLAVAALPEEFPVVFTLFLGVGVYHLAQRKALVRRAVSVENIGRITCICSDKTGTITEGRLDLTHLLPAGGLAEPALLDLARDASRDDSGDPLDEAIQRLAPRRDGVTPALAVYPFTEGRKRETSILRRADGAMVAVTKGAAEIVLTMSDLSASERQSWSERIERYASEGHKLIGCAWRDMEDDWAGGEPDRGFRWAGLLAFEDPVREGVPQAVRQCRAAGIRVVMVTGDHPATASAVARQIGLGDEARMLTGDALDALLERGDRRALGALAVVARAVPAQKVGLVRALQKEGEIVAVTGDGVNDVPALQAADIGIAMGRRGTRSAREAAAIVLLDDNFRSIVRSVAEGQQLFDNLRRSFQYLLMIHVPLVLTAAIIPLVGFPLLYLPLHIVWLELVIHPSAMLAFQERRDPARLERRGERRARFFGWRDWIGILLVGAGTTASVLALYVHSLDGLLPVEHARAHALAALTLSSAALVAGLSRLGTPAARWISGATVGLTVFLVQTPGVSDILHLQALHADDWLRACTAALAAGLLALWLSREATRTGSRRAGTSGRGAPRERPAPDRAARTSRSGTW
jgi:Ca2+-transporting ATPase